MTPRKQPTPEPLPPARRVAFPFTCPNCDGEIRTALVFCSDLCRKEAEYVRYHRRCLEDGGFARPDVQLALRIQLGLLLGGGYPEQERRVPAAVRELVITRDQGRCRKCGERGNTIDHINGNSGDFANLQLLCAPCHNRKTMERFVTITPESHPKESANCDRLMLRVFVAKPERSCDANNWKDLSRTIRSARVTIIAAARERCTGKKCPVCLAPLKKAPRREYLKTKIKRLQRCTTCSAGPAGRTCECCGQQSVWTNSDAAACSSCGQITPLHRTSERIDPPETR